MFEQLNEKHINTMEQQLIVPLAVSDILEHNLAVEPDMQYSLHMALSEIDPDSALLAIALCARDLADKFYLEVPIAAALKKEAQYIIDTYGPNWIHHHKNEPIQAEGYARLLNDVPEDLEALADIMDALCGDIAEEGLSNNYNAAVAIAQLLSIQARAHMEIADYLLLEIQNEHKVESGDGALVDTENKVSAMMDITPSTADNQAIDNNIILFPIDRVN